MVFNGELTQCFYCVHAVPDLWHIKEKTVFQSGDRLLPTFELETDFCPL